MAQMNLQTRNIVSASSGTNAEDDVLMIPIPHQPLYIQIQEGHCNENGSNSNPPTSLLSIFVNPQISNDQRIGAMESSDHTALTIIEPQMDHTASTILESQMCRICGFDEEEDEDEDVLVELGCSCKGEMSKMHKKCILKWYGVRMLLEKLYTCELCNTTLHINAQLIVARGVTDHRNGGRAILMNALKSSLASYAPHIEVELAANYKELVQLLLDERAEWYRHQRQVVAYIEAQAVNSDSNPQAEEIEPLSQAIMVVPTCGRGALIMSIGATLVSVGLYTYILVHLYGNVGYN